MLEGVTGRTSRVLLVTSIPPPEGMALVKVSADLLMAGLIVWFTCTITRRALTVDWEVPDGWC